MIVTDITFDDAAYLGGTIQAEPGLVDPIAYLGDNLDDLDGVDWYARST